MRHECVPWSAHPLSMTKACISLRSRSIGPASTPRRKSKRALFSTERDIYGPGHRSCTLLIDSWQIGLGICYDAGFPEHARALAESSCHAYLVSPLFSRGNGYHESRVWFPARALDNTMYALMSNHVGITGGWSACGSSAIWDPLGNLVEEAGDHEQTLIVTDLSPSPQSVRDDAYRSVRRPN